jgi:diacylglycerol kinase family enzyme
MDNGEAPGPRVGRQAWRQDGGAKGRRPSSGARSVEALVNPLSGGAGPGAAAELQKILHEAGLSVQVHRPSPTDLADTLTAIRKRNPDLLIILAGDGTARTAAEICGPKGPMLAPLAGGTMNMLAHAIYGEVSWQEALKDLLAHGEEQMVGGGMIGGRAFYVAALFGSAALFAPAREAARRFHLGAAARSAKRAYFRAFARRLTFRTDGGGARAHSMALICPIISRALSDEDPRMEAVAINPGNSGEALRIGLKVALTRLVGDWRADPAIEAMPATKGVIIAPKPIPALLDGEPVQFGRKVRFRFRRRAFRVLAPPHKQDEEI